MLKYLIAIPCFDTVYTDFMLSLLNMQRIGQVYCQVVKSSLIYDARNRLAKQAVDDGFDRMLWLDSDIMFEPDLMLRLAEHLDNGLEYVSGLYFKRQYPTAPVCFKTITQRTEDKELITEALLYEDYPKDQLFEVDATGFGAVMVSVDLIKRIKDKYGLPFSPQLGLGEDMSFCWRAKQVGAKLYCDSSIKLKHVGYTAYTEDTYLEQTQIAQADKID